MPTFVFASCSKTGLKEDIIWRSGTEKDKPEPPRQKNITLVTPHETNHILKLIMVQHSPPPPPPLLNVYNGNRTSTTMVSEFLRNSTPPVPQTSKQEKQTYSPRNGVCEEKVPKELCHIPEFVCLKTMDHVILKKTKSIVRKHKTHLLLYM